jgi:uncharacterized protein involved in exopolysaccharide biosynthesis
MTEPHIKKNDSPAEIRLLDLIIFFNKYILILVIAVLVFGLAGILYSFTLTRKYTAQTILLPEYSMGNSNSFFSIAAGAEKGGAEKLTPDLYPDILHGTPFGIQLLSTPVTDEKANNFPSLEAFLHRNADKQSLFRQFLSLFSKSSESNKEVRSTSKLPNILLLTRQENSLIRSATNLVSASVDKKNGIITIECEMTDPVVAAILVEASKNYLINYVEEYRTSKTSEQVKFFEKMVNSAKKRQQDAEYALQSYRDRNRNTFLNVARIEEQRLQGEYTLSQALYNDLSAKLEQSKIRVKEEKPVFKVLEPSKVPLDKSSPKRPIIAFIFAVIGGLSALIYIVFFKEKLHLKLL